MVAERLQQRCKGREHRIGGPRSRTAASARTDDDYRSISERSRVGTPVARMNIGKDTYEIAYDSVVKQVG